MKRDFLPTAARLRELSLEVDKCKDVFDLSHEDCEACDRRHYLQWRQKQVYDRVLGAAQRLVELAHLLERRNDDPEFNPETPDGDQDRAKGTGAASAKRIKISGNTFGAGKTGVLIDNTDFE